MSVANIINTFESASEAQYNDGERWYSDAWHHCYDLADGTPYSLEQAVGVVAAVSPRMPWAQNVKLALRIVDARGKLEAGCLRNNLRKANTILNGGDPWQLLTSQKVRAFFECIIHKGETDVVCVDRHALMVSRGFEVFDTRMGAPEYRRIAGEYQEAARELGMPAAKVQAITWTVWRDR